MSALENLLRAAERGDAPGVAAILDRHPDLVNQRGTLGGHTGLRTALHFGIHHQPVVRALLERGADPNIRDDGDNAFPLHFAAEKGDLALIRLLVEHGAQTVAGEVDDHELDVIGWACVWEYVSGREAVVQYLLDHGARHTWFSAVAMGAVDAIAALARAGADLNRPMDRTNHRRRALHLAVVKKQARALELLMDLGADLDATDAAGLTPLDQAALDGEIELAQLLVERGAELRLPAALALGRDEAVEDLLREDPSCLEPGHQWGTLIVRAAARGSRELIESLIRHGADVNAADGTETAVDGTPGYTALHAAAWHGNIVAAQVLLAHGADPRARDGRYCGTPAGWADYNRQRECRDAILGSERIDIFDAISFDRPERMGAILERDPEALHRRFGCTTVYGSEAHLTPLAWATFHGNPRAVRMLMSRRAELASGGLLSSTHDERVAAFLRMACLDWAVGGPDREMHTRAAGRLLQRHPEIAGAHLLTAVVCGDVAEVERRLRETPAAATEVGGPRGWPPLLYLCNARLSGTAWSEHAVAIARALLDRGADPNVYYEGGDPSIHYTAITSLVGRGEEQARVHPKARELASLLLERGAEPYDMQFFYNAFAGHASQRRLADEDDFVWLLDLIYQHSIRRGRERDWQDPEWKMLDMGGYGHGAGYLISNAESANAPRLVEWALAHGAGDFRGTRSEDIWTATERNQLTTVAQYLRDGVSPNLERPKGGERLLHRAAYHGAVDVVRLLVERGAEIDPIDAVHGTTPIHWALWGGSHRAVDALAPFTRDVWTLTWAGNLERLRELLKQEPARAKSRDEHETVLFYLPDDEEIAAEMVRLLLANGADATVRRPDGITAAHVARARGLDAAAELLTPNS